MKRIVLLSILVFLLSTEVLPAQEKTSRQYYSAWRKHAEKPYYYRWYYFKTSPTDKEHQYHYGIYYPSRGKRVYLYNPHAKTFWGYYDMKAKGYSLLPPEKRKQRIDDIPAEAFPEPGKMPAIPGAKDGTEMLRPPNDLPKPEDLPDGVLNGGSLRRKTSMVRLLSMSVVTVLSCAFAREPAAGSSREDTDSRRATAPSDDETINRIMVAAHVRDIDGKGNRGTKRNLDSRVLSGNATDREKTRLLELYRKLAKTTPPKGSIGGWKSDTMQLVRAMKGIISGRKNAREQLAKALDCKGCHAKYRVSFAPGLSNLTDLKYYDMLPSDPVRKRLGLSLPTRLLVELAGKIKKAGGSPVIEVLDKGWSLLVDFPERTSDDAIRLLRGARDVSMIRILNGGVSDKGLGYLRDLPDLRLLVIHSEDVTDEGMKEVGRLSKLRTLELMNARAAGKGLAEIARLMQLKKLHLFATKVEDDDLAPVTDMWRLKSLSLPGTVGEAASAKHASRYSASLRPVVFSSGRRGAIG